MQLEVRHVDSRRESRISMPEPQIGQIEQRITMSSVMTPESPLTLDPAAGKTFGLGKVMYLLLYSARAWDVVVD